MLGLACVFAILSIMPLQIRPLLVVLLAGLLCAACASAISGSAKRDVLTYHYDNARTGANTEEKTLTPEALASGTFGKLFSMKVDGYVYAQPLLKTSVNIPGKGKRDALFIATEHDSVYAFDALTGVQFWQVSFIDPRAGITTVPYQEVGTKDIVPEIGITGTPVIDAQTETLYVVSKVRKADGKNGSYEQQLHALDLATGAEKFNGPVAIAATFQPKKKDAAPLVFDSKIQNQRASLLLQDGVVYAAWASHGSNGDYHGWILSYDAHDLSRQLSVWNSTPTGEKGGIWMSGGGLSSDGLHIFASIGNGTYDAAGGGEDYADSLLEFSKAPAFAVTDSFTPHNQDELERLDVDYGVTSPVLVPGPGGRQFILAAAKAGVFYVLDRTDLGRFDPNGDHSLNSAGLPGSMHNNFAFWDDTAYVCPDKGYMYAFSLSGDKPNILVTSQTAHSFTGEPSWGGGHGCNTVVSASGLSKGIVWTLDNNSYATGTPGMLLAYDAKDLTRKLYDSSLAPDPNDFAPSSVKFTAPVVANGLVYVPGKNEVAVYGLKK